MLGNIAVASIFAVACAATIYLILRRPYLFIRIGNRAIKIESYFVGSLLGPILIMAFGLLNYGQIADGLQGRHQLNPLGILVLFLSMVFMSIFLDITGFFEYCARTALRFAGGRRAPPFPFAISYCVASYDIHFQ
ncbi:MAG: hypothetical protein CVT47_01625 [Thermoplasmata archaeon HGW-Thermoplasmata-2]|nr:MAG: hypothetical protein CVT47_01625 [Thermoplasmata archaeon HGW-Thermoplasmata-2]